MNKNIYLIFYRPIFKNSICGCFLYREKMEAQLEKESRMKQLNSVGNNHSRDSAIDADMQEWDTESVEVSLVSILDLLS